MAERRQIGSLARAGPIEQVSQRAVLDERTRWKINQPSSLKKNEQAGKFRRERPSAFLAHRTRTMKGIEGHPHWSCAPGTRALRRASFDGRT